MEREKKLCSHSYTNLMSSSCCGVIVSWFCMCLWELIFDFPLMWKTGFGTWLRTRYKTIEHNTIEVLVIYKISSYTVNNLNFKVKDQGAVRQVLRKLARQLRICDSGDIPRVGEKNNKNVDILVLVDLEILFIFAMDDISELLFLNLSSIYVAAGRMDYGRTS